MKKIYPLTNPQNNIFYKIISNDELTQYNLPVCIEIPKAYYINNIEPNLKACIESEVVFRTKFQLDENGRGYQWFDYDTSLEIVYKNMTKEDLLFYMNNDFVRPFDVLGNENLARFECIFCEESAYLLVDFSHLIMDGISFYRNFARCLLGKNPISNSSNNYEKLLLSGMSKERFEKLDEERLYFKNAFNNAEFTNLSDKNEDFIGKHIRATSIVKKEDIKEYCIENNIDIPTLFQTAFSYSISILSLEKTVAYGVTSFARNKNTMKMMGMYINTVPFIFTFDYKEKVRDIAHKISENTREFCKRDSYSLFQFYKELGKKPEIIYNFFASNLFSSKKYKDKYNINISRLDVKTLESTLNITIENDIDGNYAIHVDSNDENYTMAQIDMIAKAIKAVIINIVKNPNARLSEIGLVSDEDKDKVIEKCKGETLIYDEHANWLSLFRKSVNMYKDKIAVSDSSEMLTYEMLDKESNKVADYLIKNGCKKNEFVAIFIPRSVNVIISIIGIHKAMAAYLPIDMEYPKERVQYMKSDSKVRITITEKIINEIRSGNYSDEDRIGSEVYSANKNDQYAYIIYTSGSTGLPKGVVIYQSGLMNFTCSTIKQNKLTPKDKIGHHFSFSFDSHIEDVFPVLGAGASIHIMEEDIRKDIQSIYEFCVKNNITGGGFTTTVGKLLLQYYNLPQRYITCIGEQLTGVIQKECQIVNRYGPTECTNVCSLFFLEKDKEYARIPIGKPMPNSWCFITDKNGNLLPIGAKGELCFAGIQVGMGYLNQKEKTEASFSDCTFVKGMRMYKTGDLAMYNADEILECLGRIDNQLKFNGYRIEPGEIENVIVSKDGIDMAAVKMIGKSGNARLVAFYSCTDKEVSESEIQSFVEESKLPSYMRPTNYKKMETIPRLPNGKIDRKALTLDKISVEVKRQEKTSSLEKQILSIIKDGLDLPKDSFISVDDNLISYGLTSLHALTLLAELHRICGVTISYTDFMKKPTVKNLSENITILGGESQAKSENKCDYYNLTDEQLSIYMSWEANKGTTQYNISLAGFFKGFNPHKLKDAVEKVADYYTYLRYRLSLKDSVPVLVEGELNPVSFAELSDDEPVEEYFQNKVKPFDLFNEPLIRCGVFYNSEGSYLFIDCHHIIIDGFSIIVMLNSIIQVYYDMDIVPQRMSALEYHKYMENVKESPKYEQASKYFENLLKNNKGTKYLNSQKVDACEGVGRVETTISVCDALKCCNENNFTLNNFLQASLSFALRNITRSDSTMHLTVYTGRDLAGRLNDTVGMFIRMLPVVLDKETALKETPINIIKKLQFQLLDSISLEYFPYMEMSQRFGANADVIFIFQGDLNDTAIKYVDKQIFLKQNRPKFPIYINVYTNADELTIEIDYDMLRFEREDMQKFLDEFVKIINRLPFATTLEDIQGDANHFEKTKVLQEKKTQKKDAVIKKEKPNTQTEIILKNLLANALEVDDIGVTESFLSLGLNSIKAMQLVLEISKITSTSVRISDIFEYSTIRNLSAFIDEMKKNDQINIVTATKNLKEYYPLLRPQVANFLDMEQDTNTTKYNMYNFLELADGIELNKLIEAIKKAYNNHGYIKSHFGRVNDKPVQFNRMDSSVQISIYNVDTEMDEEAFRKIIRPYDLFNDDMYRISVYITPTKRYLALEFNHLIIDGMSIRIIKEDIIRAYMGYEIEPEKVTAFDYVTYVENKKNLFDEAIDYYDKLLVDVSVLKIPSKDKDGIHTDNSRKDVFFEAKAVDDFCRINEVTVNSFFHTVFSMYMSKITGLKRFAYISGTHGRLDVVSMRRTVGMFYEAFPVVYEHNDTKSFIEQLKDMDTQLSNSFKYPIYPFYEIKKRHNLPLEIMLNYQGGIKGDKKIETLDIKEITVQRNEVVFPAGFEIFPIDDEYILTVDYKSEIYTDEEILNILNQIKEMILEITSNEQDN